MGDLSTGLAYLCGTCCCLRDGDVPSDGSGFRSGNKPDPREREVDEFFMTRDYKQDAVGRFIRQPTPTSGMYSRQQSDRSSNAKKSSNLEVPQLDIANSTSTSGTSGSQNKVHADSGPIPPNSVLCLPQDD